MSTVHTCFVVWLCPWLIVSGAPTVSNTLTCGGYTCHWDQYCDEVMDKCMSCYGLCRPGRINGDSFATRECEEKCLEYYKYQHDQMLTTTHTSTAKPSPVTKRPEKLVATQQKGTEDAGASWCKMNTYILFTLIFIIAVLVVCILVLIFLVVKLKNNLTGVSKKQCITADKQLMTEPWEGTCDQGQQKHASEQLNGSVAHLGPEQSSSPNGQNPRPHLHDNPARFVDDATSHDKRPDNFLISGQQPKYIEYGYGQVGSGDPLLDSSDQSDGAYSQSVISSSDHQENETLLKTLAPPSNDLSVPA